MLFFPLNFGGTATRMEEIPAQTLAEQKCKSWRKTEGDGLPDPPKVTCPADTRKQWLPVERFKRHTS